MIDVDLAFARFRTAGEPEALAVVFDGAAPELLRIASHLTMDLATAEDLVQATFLTAIESVDRFDASRRVLPWLTGILTNHARMLRRTSRRRLDPRLLEERVLQGAESPACAAQGPEEIAVGKDLSRRVSDAIAALPVLYQPVLRLHLRHGLGPREIALDIGRSPATVRKQLERGLQMLRRHLPAGITAALGVLGTPVKGLSSVRATVLREAVLRDTVLAAMRESAGPVGGLVTTGAAIQGATTMKKLYATLLVLLLLCAIPMVTDSSDDVDSGGRVSSEESLTSDAVVPSGALQRELAAGAESRAELSTASTTGALSVHVSWLDDGSPAEGIALRAIPLDRETPVLHALRGATAADGSFHFAELEPGGWRVETDRGPSAPVAIVSAGEARVELAIPPALEVRGSVVDTLGRPVAGASLWLSEGDDLTQGSIVARTDSEGAFSLRGVQRFRYLGARAEGFRSAPLQSVDGAVGGMVRLRFRLARDGAAVVGWVRDHEGQPVAGAAVLMGYILSPAILSPMTSPTPEGYPPFSTRTNTAGEFRVFGVRGDRPVGMWVRAPGFALWRGTARPAMGTTEEVEVHLTRGGALTARLVDAAGQPCAGVPVTMMEAERASWPERVPKWAIHRQRSAADGTVRFSALPPVRMRLQTHGDTWQRLVQDVDVSEGVHVERRCTLRPVRVLRGRVTDAVGGALVGSRVSAKDHSWYESSGGEELASTTDANGAFEIRGCADQEYFVAVFEPGETGGILITEKQARPGTDVEIRVPDEKRGFASITGTIIQSSGVPLPQATIRVDQLPDSVSSVVATEDGTGRFEVPRLPAGNYRLVLFRARGPHVSLGNHEVVPGQHLELGRVEVVVPGRLLLSIIHGDGAGASGSFRLVRGERSVQSGPVAGGSAGTRWIAPGDYTLMVWGGNLPPMRKAVRIEPGQENEFTLTAPRSVAQRFEISYDESLADGEGATGLVLTFADARGNSLFPQEHRRYVGTARLTRLFVPGRYRISVRHYGSAMRGAVEFTVGARESKDPVRVTLAGK